jgi:hypothetical protein
MVPHAAKHLITAFRPRRLATSAKEEVVERISSARVVHAHDPFGPREIFNRVASMSELPIQDSRDAVGVEIEEHVLRSEVAMHDDGAIAIEAGHHRDGEALQRLQCHPRKLQHDASVSSVNQILTVVTGQDTQLELWDGQVRRDHGRDWKVITQG